MSFLALCVGLLLALPSLAHEEGEIGEDVETVVVFGRAHHQLGHATAASEGRVGGLDLELRPMARVGELLEAVPGLIATQHSGAGKSNQLFLRGFNLDHGTDFAAHVDGVPINLRSHGHGQGYLDLNFVIPELIASIDFRKGPYRADVGDFASAGASFLSTYDALPDSIAKIEVGAAGFVRGLVAANLPVEEGEAIAALEAKTFEDPFELDAELLHLNGFAKWTRPLFDGTLRLSAQGYYADWRSTDQVPRRAVDAGAIGRLGFIDPDLGGETIRISATAAYTGPGETPLELSTWGLYYRLDLFSNFTYFTRPDGLGDELTQQDERFAWGARAEKPFAFDVLGEAFALAVGAETRLDVIPELGLFRSDSRNRFASIRSDEVVEWSGALFGELRGDPTDWLSWMLGVRGDLYVFDVNARSGLGAETHSGTEIDGLVSPKLSVVLRPPGPFEVYLNAGGGFHSNDARGTTQRIDPDPEPGSGGGTIPSVDPLARQWGAEIGARFQPDQRWHLTAALWWLRSQSELVFVGDGGFTEVQGGSQRYGVELTGFARPVDWLAFDAAYSWSDANFTNLRSGQDRIPGAIEQVLSLGATVTAGAFSGSLRVRHFGAYSLDEVNEQRAPSTTLLNLGARYDWRRFQLGLSVLNLLDSRDSDIEYFFASQLPGEPGPVEDTHRHPVATRQVRFSLSTRF